MTEDQIFSAPANARDAIAGPGLPRHPRPPATPAGPAAPGPAARRSRARPGSRPPAWAVVMTGPAKTSSSRKET